MTTSILLGSTTWDLLLDASGNIAVASEPYSLVQDAASAIRTWKGEVFWDTTLGVPYLTQILGHIPPPALVKAQLEAEVSKQIPTGLASVKVLLQSLTGRRLVGQVQSTPSTAPGSSSRPVAIDFVVTDPQVA